MRNIVQKVVDLEISREFRRDSIINAVMHDGRDVCDGPGSIKNENDDNIGCSGDPSTMIEQTLIRYHYEEWGIWL